MNPEGRRKFLNIGGAKVKNIGEGVGSGVEGANFTLAVN